MTEPTILNVHRVLVHPELPPKTFHKLFWARVGNDMVLEVAHADLQDLREVLIEVRDKKSERQATLFVTERYSMTPTTVIELLRTASDLARDLVK
jgi:hypothetical protein